MNNTILDPIQIAKSFNRAAATYDNAALLPMTVGKRLLEKLALMTPSPPQSIVDLGAGSGSLTQELATCYPTAKLIAVDIAYAMLRFAKTNHRKINYFACAKAAHLPVANESVDLVFSNLVLPWCCNDLLQIFTEIKHILKPGGLFLFATLGPDTLQELRHSFATIDDNPHVHTFVDMHNIGDCLLQSGLHMPVMEMEKITLAYRKVDDLIHDLKMLGAHNLDPKRHRALTPKSYKQKLALAYECFRTPDHLLPATCEVIYGHAWQPISTREVPISKSGETFIPLSKVRKNT